MSKKRKRAIGVGVVLAGYSVLLAGLWLSRLARQRNSCARTLARIPYPEAGGNRKLFVLPRR
jgi:hypothetical protein